MKTPLQELIEQLKKMRDDYHTIVGIDAGLPIHTAVMLAKSMLEKEKEVINDAYITGFSDRDIYHQAEDDYYNETFNTKEK